MIILSWNCRGMGHPSAVPSLRDLVRSHKPDVMFLCETLCHANKIEDITRILGFESCFTVDRHGRSGGLAMLWCKNSTCEILNYSQNYINMLIHEERQQPWRLTGFYGLPDRGQRRQSWDMLRSLSMQSTLPWCIVGDFNDILSHDEKRGRVDHPNWLIKVSKKLQMIVVSLMFLYKVTSILGRVVWEEIMVLKRS